MLKQAESQGHFRNSLQQLLASRPEVFEFFQSRSLQGVWLWSLEDPSQEWVSPDFWEMLGYGPEMQVRLGEQWWRLVHPEDRHIAQESFVNHLTDPDCAYDHVVRYVHRSGNTVWIRSQGMVVHSEAGIPEWMVGIHQDVTAHKAIEADLAQRTLDLERRNRELQQFAYAASHDLQGPARRIQGFAEWMLADFGDELPERARQYVDRILASANSMAAMSRGILEFSRLDRKLPRMARVPLDAVIDEVLLVLDQKGHRDGELVPIALHREPLPEVLGNRNLLDQLFSNLLSNAVRYRSERPLEVWIRAEESEDFCEVTVQDNGIGFHNKDRELIFELFHRLHRQDEIPGSGFGLSICQKIVVCHGGRIWADGEPGEGATFHVSLPIHGQPAVLQPFRSDPIGGI